MLNIAYVLAGGFALVYGLMIPFTFVIRSLSGRFLPGGRI